MHYIKLQVCSLLIIIFMTGLYLKFLTENKIKHNFLFNIILVVCPLAVIFDGITAVTVNYRNIIPDYLNLVFHGFFFILMDFMIIAAYAYMLDKTTGLPEKKTARVLVFFPSIISVFLILRFLPQTYFVDGIYTDYSMGPSVYAAYGSLLVHFLMIFALVILKRRTILKRKLGLFLSFMTLSFAVLLMQVFFPEFLITAVSPAMIIIGFYFAGEDPAIVKLEMSNDETVTGFATLVENRDDNTGGHIKRTREFVKIILNQMKKDPYYVKIISKDYIENVVRSAPMHDIGKIAIPDYILQKPGKLTDEEFEIMKTHAEKGGKIIKQSFNNIGTAEFQKIVYETALYHHEKWNGKGYPQGLTGPCIPLHARIMAIADVFDAVSADRCYRKAMPLEKCFSIIEEGSGVDFDPELTRLFLQAKDEITVLHEKYGSGKSD